MASLDIKYYSHWYLSYHRGLNKQSLLPIEVKGKLRLTGWTGSSCELYAILATRLPWLGLPNIEPAVVNTSCVELEQEAENSFEETPVLIEIIELTLVCVVTPVPCKLWLDCIWVRQPSTMHSLIIILRANHVTSSQSDRSKHVTWRHIKSLRAHFAVL